MGTEEAAVRRTGGLRSRWQQAVHSVAAGGSQSTVQGDYATAMSARQTEKIAVRDLLRGDRRADFGHCCRRDSVGPELVLAACGSEKQKSVGGCFGRPRPRLLAGAVGEPVNVFDGQCWSAGASWKDWHAAIESDISARDSPEQRFDELIHTLSRLAGEIRQSLFQCSVHGNRGVRHNVIVPR